MPYFSSGGPGMAPVPLQRLSGNYGDGPGAWHRAVCGGDKNHKLLESQEASSRALGSEVCRQCWS